VTRPGWIAWAGLALLAGVAVWGLGDVRRPFAPLESPAPVAESPAPVAGEVEGLVRSLDAPVGSRWAALWRLREMGPASLSALPRLVELLGSEEPLTRRLAAEVLGRIGPEAVAAQDALRTAWDASQDKELDFAIEGAMERIGGWTCFPHEVPEAITFLEHPFLRVVEEAHRRTWLKGEDAEIAARAWRQTQEHARRLVSDRLYRLGDQTLALMLASNVGQNLTFESLWSPPFLLCASDGALRTSRFLGPSKRGTEVAERRTLAELAAEPKHFAGLLGAATEVAQTVYGRMLAEHAPTLALKRLEDEFAGRPDLRLGVRSFADGFPMVLWLWAGRDTHDPEAPRGRIDLGLFGHGANLARQEALLYLPADGWMAAQVSALDGKGRRESLDVSSMAFGAAATLLEAFRRQANQWSNPRLHWDAVALGFCASLAGWKHDLDGRLVPAEPAIFRSALQEYAVATAADAGKTRWVPLREHVEMEGWKQVSAWLTKHGSSGNGNEGIALHRGQSWGLGKFLGSSPDVARRGAWAEALRALLRREKPASWVHALGPRTEGEWAAMQSEFATFLDGLVAAEVPDAPGAAGR
jgi:hypothetical protein